MKYLRYKLFLFALMAASVCGAQNFDKDFLYTLSGVTLEYDGQEVQLSEISGSWRIIDPFKQHALRMGDNGVEWGVENGSDEWQKWLIDDKGNDNYLLSAVREPQRTVSVVLKRHRMFRKLVDLNANTIKDSKLAPVWEDETVFAINKLPSVAHYVPYPNEAALRADKAHYQKPWLPSNSSLMKCLDGKWKFHFVSSPEQRPDASAVLADATQGWDDITVPGCWEMQGYDHPIYCNVEYPHDNTPPFIKARPGFNDGGKNYGVNPVGTYQRTFTVSKEWLNQRTIIRFDAIHSAGFVYLNGRYVGYTQGQSNVAEFDLTPYLFEGKNNLVVQVLRWCDGSYLECQDMFRMSGICRSVYLYNVPRASIRNHQLSSTFNDALTHADLNVNLLVEGKFAGKAKVKLFDPKGKLVGENFATFNGDSTYSATISVEKPQLWTAETPNLYTVHIIQTDSEGHEEMAFATKYGFRKVEIKNSLLYVNNHRVLLKGVNRHDTDPEGGRTVSVKSMLRDVLLMKQNNINTLRTSHYPNDVAMYALCDYYGLYVCCEADLEDHANQSISDMPSWKPAFVDRIERMVQIYRNYPCIAFWSLGNESGGGRNFEDCYLTAHLLDNTRPVHYEGTRERGKPFGGNTYSDFYSVMYPSMQWMHENTSNLDKPLFICEYAHAMGNAIGNLDQYMQVMRNSNATVGGCIWDWADQAIYDPTELKQGIRRLHTGYDYPGPHQGNFCSNGVVTAERDYTAKLAEVKGAYQYIVFSKPTLANGKWSVVVKNDYAFQTLENYTLEYEYLVNGYSAKKGRISLGKILPQDSSAILIPQLKMKNANSHEILLNLRAVSRKAQTFADKGHAVAQRQFVINEAQPLTMGNINENDVLNLEHDNSGQLHIYNNNVSVLFDETTGQMTSLQFGGREMLAAGQGFVFNNHRWIENDRYANTDNGLSSEAVVEIGRVDEKANCRQLTTYINGTLADQKIVYNVYGNGEVWMDVTITPHTQDLRRAGLVCQLDSSLQCVDYYALGPWENYCDRHDGVTVGRYATTVDELMEHYVKPQTTGDRAGLRELMLTTPDGYGLKIETEGNVSFSASRYTDTDLMNARHEWELEKQPFVYLHLDGAQRGLGNASCGPGTLQEYCIPQLPVNYRLRITSAK